MRIAGKLLLAGFITSFAVWAAGCGDQGGGGGAPATPSTPSTPSETPADTPPVETDTGTPAAPAKGDTGAAAEAPATGGWGTLKGRFVYGGEPPTQDKLEITKDTEFCTREHPLDESIVVNQENKGLQNVVLWIYVGRRDTPPQIHESFQDMISEPTRLDNLWCRFEPHVKVVYTGQTLVIGNKDEVGHNTKADLNANSPFNQTIPAGEDITQTFEKAERLPSPVSCSIHPWMQGYLHVLDHPYVAVSDADGNFDIPNVPTGRWTFQVWHETAGYITTVTHDGQQKTWDRGRVELDIAEGEVDLGDITVDAAMFSK